MFIVYTTRTYITVHMNMYPTQYSAYDSTRDSTGTMYKQKVLYICIQEYEPVYHYNNSFHIYLWNTCTVFEYKLHIHYSNTVHSTIKQIISNNL